MQAIVLLMAALIIAGIGFIVGYFVFYLLLGILFLLTILSLFFLKGSNRIADASTPIALMEIINILFLVGLIIGFVSRVIFISH